MQFKPLIILAVSAALVLLGAACAKKSSQTNVVNSGSNTNASTVNLNTNNNLNAAVIDLTNTPTTAVPAGAAVSMTASGFSPSTVTVKVGGTVTWTNTDTAVHQPASDPHPTHTGLAGFDALGGVSPGKTFRFTFTRAGTFGYHDHVFTTRTGKVIVEP